MWNGKAAREIDKNAGPDQFTGKMGIGFVLVIAVFLESSSAGAFQEALDCDFAKDKNRHMTVRIENLDIVGAELRFPEGYLLSRPFVDGALRGGLLLRANVHDFSADLNPGFGKGTRISKTGAGQRDHFNILITSYLPMQVVWQRTLSNKYKVFGIGQDNAKSVRAKDAGHGLMTPFGYRADGFLRDDIFFHKDPTGVTDIIVCSSVGSVPNPGCGHIFEAGAYDIKITYGRGELIRWRKLRDSTAKLLHCFTTKEPKQLP